MFRIWGKRILYIEYNWGDFVQGDFVPGGILSRGILSGGVCPGRFCPRMKNDMAVLCGLNSECSTLETDHNLSASSFIKFLANDHTFTIILMITMTKKKIKNLCQSERRGHCQLDDRVKA